MPGVNLLSKKVQTIVPGITKQRPIEQFGEEGWGKRARDWVQAAQRLGHNEWEAIMDDVNMRIGIDRSSDQADSEEMQEEDAEVANPRGLIEL